MTLSAIIALVVCASLTPLAGAAAWKCDAVSRPDGHRKLQHRPTPLWGGLSVYIALTAGLAAGWLLVYVRRTEEWAILTRY